MESKIKTHESIGMVSKGFYAIIKFQHIEIPVY